MLLFAISFGIGVIIGIPTGIITAAADLDEDTMEAILDLVTDLGSIIVSGLLTFGFLSFFLKISRNEEVTCNELFSKVKMFWKFIGFSIFIGGAVVLGFICFIIPGIILALGFSQTQYILLDNPDISVIDAMKKSWNMMKGYKMDYLVLQLSFLGWAILMVFTLFIGYLWLIPYMSVTQANFYNKVKENMSE